MQGVFCCLRSFYFHFSSTAWTVCGTVGITLNVYEESKRLAATLCMSNYVYEESKRLPGSNYVYEQLCVWATMCMRRASAWQQLCVWATMCMRRASACLAATMCMSNYVYEESKRLPGSNYWNLFEELCRHLVWTICGKVHSPHRPKERNQDKSQSIGLYESYTGASGVKVHIFYHAPLPYI